MQELKAASVPPLRQMFYGYKLFNAPNSFFFFFNSDRGSYFFHSPIIYAAGAMNVGQLLNNSRRLCLDRRASEVIEDVDYTILT